MVRQTKNGGDKVSSSSKVGSGPPPTGTKGGGCGKRFPKRKGTTNNNNPSCGGGGGGGMNATKKGSRKNGVGNCQTQGQGEHSPPRPRHHLNSPPRRGGRYIGGNTRGRSDSDASSDSQDSAGTAKTESSSSSSSTKDQHDYGRYHHGGKGARNGGGGRRGPISSSTSHHSAAGGTRDRRGDGCGASTPSSPLRRKGPHHSRRTNGNEGASGNKRSAGNKHRHNRGRHQNHVHDEQDHDTKEEYSFSACSIGDEEKEKYLALDCEMVGIGPNGVESALARVSIVNWDGEIVLDTYVKVPHPVTDYRTFVSGIRPSDLEVENGAVEADDVRRIVLELLQGKVVIGHALKNDFIALGITHPWYDIRDTAKYRPFMKPNPLHSAAEGNDASTTPSGATYVPRRLRELVLEKLKRSIQEEGCEHCSIIDAKAALDLYKLVRVKWERVMEYKLKRTREIEKMQLEQQLQLEEQEERRAPKTDETCKSEIETDAVSLTAVAVDSIVIDEGEAEGTPPLGGSAPAGKHSEGIVTGVTLSDPLIENYLSPSLTSTSVRTAAVAEA